MQTTLRCRICGGNLGTLPGQWLVLRELIGGEQAKAGRGSLVCRHKVRSFDAVRGGLTPGKVCGVKWEIEQKGEQAA